MQNRDGLNPPRDRIVAAEPTENLPPNTRRRRIAAIAPATIGAQQNVDNSRWSFYSFNEIIKILDKNSHITAAISTCIASFAQKLSSSDEANCAAGTISLDSVIIVSASVFVLVAIYGSYIKANESIDEATASATEQLQQLQAINDETRRIGSITVNHHIETAKNDIWQQLKCTTPLTPVLLTVVISALTTFNCADQIKNSDFFKQPLVRKCIAASIESLTALSYAVMYEYGSAKISRLAEECVTNIRDAITTATRGNIITGGITTYDPPTNNPPENTDHQEVDSDAIRRPGPGNI